VLLPLLLLLLLLLPVAHLRVVQAEGVHGIKH
jgi:hypothetical protein